MKHVLTDRNLAASDGLEQPAFDVTYLKGYDCDYNLEEKLSDLISYGKEAGLCIMRSYRDVVCYCNPKSVPQFDELKAAIADQKIRSVLAWSLCDFGYNIETIYKVLDFFSFAKVRVVALKEGLDTSKFLDPANSNLISVLSRARIGLEVDRISRINDGKSILISHMIWRSIDM